MKPSEDELCTPRGICSSCDDNSSELAITDTTTHIDAEGGFRSRAPGRNSEVMI